jgi:large subunit ribosomal protein L21
MSKYVIVKFGSSQEKVSVGDKLNVSSNLDTESIIPVLASPKKGVVIVDEKELSKYKVEFKVLGSKKTKKINIFQYKNKTGNRRRIGYRDENKVIEITKIHGFDGIGEEE